MLLVADANVKHHAMSLQPVVPCGGMADLGTLGTYSPSCKPPRWRNKRALEKPNMNREMEILEILERDARIPAEEIAAMLGAEPSEIRQRIAEMEQDGIILGYKAVVNHERVRSDLFSCLIEVQVTPERGLGFDRIAERIYRFPEVRSLYLLSGNYDLLVVVEGSTMKEIAQFVIDKLATLENVRSTTTHFMLKKYKDMGTILVGEEQVHRIPITP